MNKSFIEEFHIIYDDCIELKENYTIERIIYNITINILQN